jgi:predicted nucleic acid-binding protein
MSVVSNASALINLARIGKLNLLRELYGELVIPEAVWHDIAGFRVRETLYLRVLQDEGE